MKKTHEEACMKTIQLKIQDSVLEKIMYFLRSLPKSEVEIIEKEDTLEQKDDFIARLSSRPMVIEDQFLSREDANAR
jgi:hypothetical protein